MKLPDPVRRLTINSVGGALVGAFAAILSFDTLNRVALGVGFDGSVRVTDSVTLHNSWLLPLAIDIYAFVATRIWLSAPKGQLATYAARNAIGAVALSVVLNSLLHLFESMKFVIGDCPPFVIGVGGIPPILVALVVHLNHLTRQHSAVAETATVPAAEPVQGVDPINTPDPWRYAGPVATVGQTPTVEQANEQVNEQAREQANEQAQRTREQVRRKRVTAKSLTAAERVTAAHAKEPTATHEQIAKVADVSVSTVRRHRVNSSPSEPAPAETHRVNGHIPDLVGAAQN